MIPHWMDTAAALGPPVFNHLWQSTLFAGVAGLIVLALRRDPARARHWIWMVASLKFLIPFSLLVGIGGHAVRAPFAAPPGPRLEFLIQEIGRPLVYPVPAGSPVHVPAGNPVPAALAALWLGGSAVVLLRWWLRWRRLNRAVRHSTPLGEGRAWEALRHMEQSGKAHPSILLASSPAALEPGVFGILRPTLLLPEGIEDHLSDQQLGAVLAHELCHVRRRDNLAAMLHMLVEAAFWFHPLVWWLGARLVDERERACDEEVLQSGGQPQAYAESILKVCELYLEPPLVCISGVMGSNLKKRIEDIMTNRTLRTLGLGRKMLLAALGLAAFVGPIALGIMNAPALAQQGGSVVRLNRSQVCTLCEPPDSIRPALQTAFFIPARPDGTPDTTAAVLQDRYNRITALRAQHPDDFWVLRTYIDCMKIEVVAPAAVVAEFRDRYNAHPNDPEAKFLYAYALYRGDSVQAVALLTDVVAKTPDFPLAWYNLAKLYTFEKEVQDWGKAQVAAERFLEYCPDSNGAVYLAARLPNSSRLANMATVLRAHITGRVDMETPAQYQMLWMVEMKTTPTAEWPRLRQRVQQDLTFLSTLDKAKYPATPGYPSLSEVLGFGSAIAEGRVTLGEGGLTLAQ